MEAQQTATFFHCPHFEVGSEDLTQAQFVLLMEWLESPVHLSKNIGDLVHILKSLQMFNIKELLVQVSNVHKEFFDEFIKYVFGTIFGLAFRKQRPFSLGFTFDSDTSVSFEITFYRESCSRPLTVNDVEIKCSLMNGKKIGDFLVLRPLGKGSYGQVSLCQNAQGQLFAAKVQPLMFHYDEVRILEKVREIPNVPCISGSATFSVFGENYGCFFMDFVQNGTLLDYVKANSSINTDEIMFMMLEVLRTLIGIHDKGVVHGDVKPENILVGIDGKPCLCDYGLSQILPKGKSIAYCSQQLYTTWYRDQPSWNKANSRVTMTNPYSGSSDFWALLLTFLHAKSGDLYKTRDSYFDVLRNGQYEDPDSQLKIDAAIDSVFLGPDSRFAHFFKKYLSIRLFKEINADMVANPYSKISITEDALRELESLLGDGIEECPGQKHTPPRPRNPLQLSSISEELPPKDEDEDEEEESPPKDEDDAGEEDSPQKDEADESP